MQLARERFSLAAMAYAAAPTTATKDELDSSQAALQTLFQSIQFLTNTQLPAAQLPAAQLAPQPPSPALKRPIMASSGGEPASKKTKLEHSTSHFYHCVGSSSSLKYVMCACV